MAKQKPQKSGGRSEPGQTFRVGPPCRSVNDVKVGDLVFIDPLADDQMIGHRLGLTKDELSRLPIRVHRVEPVNGEIFLEGRRIDAISPDHLKKAIPVPMTC
ncbi:MAG: hypothetical protein HY481_02110 [Candidatus Vogelbacteria bacterium]|nr:hypothetical protein [Candidatus Vogelbacteria bacterium]